MPTATMTSKGQFTMPKEIRDDLGLVPGSKVMFVKLPNGQYNMIPKTGKLSDLFGALHYAGMPTMTLEEMDDAVAEAAMEDDLRTRSR